MGNGLKTRLYKWVHIYVPIVPPPPIELIVFVSMPFVQVVRMLIRVVILLAHSSQ